MGRKTHKNKNTTSAVGKTIVRRSACPLSSALDIIGDKWSLLLLRDMLRGLTRFKEFEHSFEHIPTNILAARLKKLVENGLIEKQAYQSNPPRYGYYLTKKGAELLPILQALSAWGNRYFQDTWHPPEILMNLTIDELLENINNNTIPLEPSKQMRRGKRDKDGGK